MSLPSMTLTEWPPSSAFARLRLAASRAAASPVASWPQPELSIGRSCSPLGGLKCWEVIGPALDISVHSLKAVKELLDPWAEYLHEAEPKPCFIAFGVYMIGRDERKANLTLLISCERKFPRQKAVKLVRESTILREHAGVRLAESPRPPLCPMSPIALGLSNDESNEDDFTGLPSKLLYCSAPFATCGISVYAQMYDKIYRPNATVGGFVSLEGVLFGLSAAHGFVEDHKPSALPDDDISFEISFDDWIEDDDVHQEAIDLDGGG